MSVPSTSASRRSLRARLTGLAFAVAALAAPLAAHADPFSDEAPKHMALLIGNADYNQDGAVNPAKRPPEGRLWDLKNPCHDAKLIADKLKAAGWTDGEITLTPCNLTQPQMKAAIDKFLEDFTNRSGVTGLFYFSGHGMEVDGHNYIFGVDANIDLDSARRALEHNEHNHSFFATSAIDVYLLTNGVGNLTESALVVILDACRNDPIYAEIEKVAPAAPHFRSPSRVAGGPRGIVVAYSTSGGEFARDGAGENSLYAATLARYLAPRRTFDSVINAVVTQVQIRSKQLKEDPPQVPDSIGRLPGPPDWCVYRCPPSSDETAPLEPAPETGAREGDAPRLALRAPSTDRRRFLADQAETAASSPSVTPVQRSKSAFKAPEVYFDAEKRIKAPLPEPPYTPEFNARAQSVIAKTPVHGLEDPMRFDVFWCDGGPDSKGLELKAKSLANSLTAFAAASDAAASGGQIGSVRVRALTPEANSLAGYRYKDNLVVYDAGDQAELKWSTVVRVLQPEQLSSLAKAEKSPGYISMFVCKAPATPSRRTDVFVQVPDPALKNLGVRVLNEIIAATPSASQSRGIETRPDGPAQTELRYYHLEDRDSVFAAAAATERLVGHPVVVKYLSQFTATTTPGRMEVWVGKQEPFLDIYARTRGAVEALQYQRAE